MRDYRWHPDGKDPGIPVSEMLTSEIEECLRVGFHANDEAPADAIRDRLVLELEIRAKGLR